MTKTDESPEEAKDPYWSDELLLAVLAEGATTIVGPGEAGVAGLGERARGSEPGANEVR